MRGWTRIVLGLGVLLAAGSGTAYAQLGRCDTPEEQAALQAATLAAQAQCDCAGAPNGRTFDRCARDVFKARNEAGLLPKECLIAATRCARTSTCGRPGTVVCCRTYRNGKTRCRIDASAADCTPPKGGSASVGSCASCCQSCGLGTCEETVRCCVPVSPGGAFPDAQCVETTADQCEASGGVNLGPGVCTPTTCEVPSTTTTTTTTTSTTETTTTTTSTTTTTAPLCGNGTIDPGEDCDPPGSLTCPSGSPGGGFVACNEDCSCPSTTTTTTTSTTTTTAAPFCGDENVDPGEDCDPPGSLTCPSGTPGGGFVACQEGCTCPAPSTTSTTEAPTTTTTEEPTTTTTTSTTTSTAAPFCGDGNVDPGEDCDPPGSLSCPPTSPGGAFTECQVGCECLQVSAG